MKKIIILAATIMILGAGCGRLGDRFEPKEEVKAPVVYTKETIDLADAEIFLRSRDDVAPGQLEVNNQSLFAKTKDGQLVELVKDVHEELGGALLASSFLVQQKEVPSSFRFVYFVNNVVEKDVPARLFAFDKDEKSFVELPATMLTQAQNIANFQYSPDHKKIAVLKSEPEAQEVLYIVDLETGFAVQRLDVPDSQSLRDPDSTLVPQPISPETKWLNDKDMSVALFEREKKEKTDRKTISFLTIDANRILNTTKFESFVYSYDAPVDAIFAQPVADAVSTAVLQVVSKKMNPPVEAVSKEGVVKILNNVVNTSPFLFFTKPVDFGFEMFAGIYEKRTNKFISPVPLDGIMAHDATLSPSGKMLATFGEMAEFYAVVRLVDLTTLHATSHKINLDSLDLNQRVSGVINSEGFGEKGPNKWLDDKTFELNLYKPVDAEKHADKNGKFSITQPLAKTLKLDVK